MKRPRALLVAASVLALLRADARSDTPAGLLATVEQFDHLTLGNAVLVGSMTVRTGHFECRISGGHAAPVLAGDATVGFFFEGRGEMQYVSADSVEAPVVIFNAKKASSLKPEKTDKGVRLTDKFTRLLWIAQGEHPYPCRYVITSKDVDQGPQYSVQISNWKTGTDVAADDFGFKAPDGARKVDLKDLVDFDELPTELSPKGAQ